MLREKLALKLTNLKVDENFKNFIFILTNLTETELS